MFVSLASPDAKRLNALYADSVKAIHEEWTRYTQLVAGQHDESELQLKFENALSSWQTASADALKSRAEDTATSRRDAIDITMNDGDGKFEQARIILRQLVKVQSDQADRFTEAEASRAI